MGFSDNFYKKVEKKTNVNKETILNLAKKIQGDNLKDENKLRDLIKEISSITGKEVSKEKEDKIILARTLYQDFNILLLDEAMSEISKYSRMKIINNINNYFKNKTIIYISHYYEKYPFDKVINLTDRKE